MSDESRKIQIPVVVTDQTKQGLESVKRGANEMADSVARAGEKASKGISGIGTGAPVASQRLDSATRSMIGSIQRTTAAMEAGTKSGTKYFEALAAQRGVSLDVLRPYLNQLEAVNRAQNAATASAKDFANVSSLFKGVAVSVAGVVASAAGLSKVLYDASVSAERLRIGLDFASAGRGRQELAYITELSNRLGLSLQSTAQAYTGFAAAARGTALEGGQTKVIFESVAKAAAVMGLSTEQSTGALLALQQMISKGTVNAEELRGQLGERLPGAFQIAARAMGVTTQELGKMLESGSVLTDDFLPKFAAQLERELGGASEKAADRLGAAANRMETAIFRLKAALGDAGGASFFESILKGATAVSNAIANDIEKITRQGPLREAANEVRELHRRQEALKNGLANGFYGPQFKAELDEVNAKLEVAKQRFRSLDAQERNATAPPDPRSNFPSRGSHARFEAQQTAEIAKATEDLVAVRRRLRGVDEGYLKDLKALEAARKAGVISEKEYVAEVSALATATYKKSQAGKESAKSQSDASKATRDAAASAREAANQYADLSLRISERIALAEEELSVGRQLTEVERQEIKLVEMLGSEKNKLGAAQKAAILRDLEQAQAKELLVQVQRSELALAQQIAAARQSARTSDYEQSAAALREIEQASTQGLASVNERVRSLEDENKAAELAATSNITLAEAIEQVTIARLRERQQGFVEGSEGYQAIEREIEARNRLLAQIAGKESRDAADRAKDDWRRAAESIQDNITDALMRGFESGKSFAANLRDVVKNMFATLVLRPVIQGVLAPVAGGLAGMLGGPASAASPGMGMLGNVAGSIFGAGGLGGSLAAGAGWLTGSTSFGGALSAAGSLIGTGTGAGIASGLGMAAGALGPIVLGAMALRSIFGGRGETRSGGQYAGTSLISGPSGGEINGQATRAAIADTQSSINDLLRRLGSSTQIATLFSGLESSEKGKGFAYAGAQLSNGAVVGQGADGRGFMNRRGSKTQEEAAKEFGEELKQVTLQALQAADVPGQLGEYLRSLGDIDALSGGALESVFNRVNKALMERQALEDRLFELTASEADKLTRMREREMAAIDETNRALLAQVHAQEDARAAAERAAQEAERAAAERMSLEDRLVELTGSEADKLARARERERAAIHATNAALLEQIYRQEDLRTAAEAAAAQAAEMKDVESALQERLRRMFDGAISEVASEVSRLTQGLGDSRDRNSLQAQFAISTAQARALDPKALERLPGLSRAIEASALGSARSRDEFEREQARLAASLNETLSIVSDQLPSASTDDVVAELKAARELLAETRTENQEHAAALVRAMNRFTQIVSRWDIDGMPDVRELA